MLEFDLFNKVGHPARRLIGDLFGAVVLLLGSRKRPYFHNGQDQMLRIPFKRFIRNAREASKLFANPTHQPYKGRTALIIQ